MSYASARNPLVRGFKSVNIGDLLQEQSANTQLVSGVASPLISFAYPDGIWTGWAQIQLYGDATTSISYLNIIEDNEDLVSNQSQSYLVNTTLSAGTTYYIKYPITRENFTEENNEIILSAQAVFTGTAPSIQIVYLQLTKIG
jgi:hypothetical protein